MEETTCPNYTTMISLQNRMYTLENKNEALLILQSKCNATDSKDCHLFSELITTNQYWMNITKTLLQKEMNICNLYMTLAPSPTDRMAFAD